MLLRLAAWLKIALRTESLFMESPIRSSRAEHAKINCKCKEIWQVTFTYIMRSFHQYLLVRGHINATVQSTSFRSKCWNCSALFLHFSCAEKSVSTSFIKLMSALR